MGLRFSISVSIFIAIILTPTHSIAQPYPAKPVRVIVVFPPGGSNDVVARIVFQKMNDLLGQQFVVDNRGGAAGTIGSEVAAKSRADGYTVMVQSTTHVANPHLYEKLPYDVLKDFIGVTTLARQVGMLVVHPSLPTKAGKDFIALAKKRPNEIVYSSGGKGSFVHLSMALMASMAGIKMVHATYRGGGPAVLSVITGETQAMLATMGSVFPHIKSNRVRPLGVSSEKRMPQFPEIPAISEFVRGYELTSWIGCFVPAGTPSAVVDTLNAALGRALADPQVASRLTAQTLDPMHMTREQFAQRLKSDYDKYQDIVRISGANKN